MFQTWFQFFFCWLIARTSFDPFICKMKHFHICVIRHFFFFVGYSSFLSIDNRKNYTPNTGNKKQIILLSTLLIQSYSSSICSNIVCYTLILSSVRHKTNFKKVFARKLLKNFSKSYENKCQLCFWMSTLPFKMTTHIATSSITWYRPLTIQAHRNIWYIHWKDHLCVSRVNFCMMQCTSMFTGNGFEW